MLRVIGLLASAARLARSRLLDESRAQRWAAGEGFNMRTIVLVGALVAMAGGVARAEGETSCGKCCGGARPMPVTSQWPVVNLSTGNQDEPSEVANGRMWVSRPVMGGVESGPRSISERYGAYDQRDLRVAVEIEPLFRFQQSAVGVINPWKVQNDRSDRRGAWSNSYRDAQDKIANRLEDARQEWLKDNGYVGGVRTFMNDAAAMKPKAQKTSEITPRATIELAPGAPKPSEVKPGRPLRVEAPRLPVQAGTARAAAVEQRVSMPVVAPTVTVSAIRMAQR